MDVFPRAIIDTSIFWSLCRLSRYFWQQDAFRRSSLQQQKPSKLSPFQNQAVKQPKWYKNTFIKKHKNAKLKCREDLAWERHKWCFLEEYVEGQRKNQHYSNHLYSVCYLCVDFSLPRVACEDSNNIHKSEVKMFQKRLCQKIKEIDAKMWSLVVLNFSDRKSDTTGMENRK